MAERGPKGPASRTVGWATALLVGVGWPIALLLSLLRGRVEPLGDASIGAVAALLGTLMLAKDWWPGKSGWPFYPRWNPLKGWYGQATPVLLTLGGWLILVNALVQGR